MSEEPSEIVPAQNWMPKVLLIGGVAGALLGVAAAYLYIQRSEEGEPPHITLGDGIKLGELAFGLLRSISTL